MNVVYLLIYLSLNREAGDMDFEADNLADQAVAGENREIEPDLDVKEEENVAILEKVENKDIEETADNSIDGLNGVADGKIDVSEDGFDPDELG